MSEEKTEEVKTEAASTPPPEAVAETPKEQPKEGTEFLDFSTLAPDVRAQVEPRFRRLYHNMKDYQRQAQMLQDQNAALMQKWEEQEGRLAKIETKTAQRETRGEMAVLRSAYKAALEAGDYDKAADVNLQIADKIADTKLRTIATKTVTVEDRPKPNGQRDPNDYIIEQWAEERDEDGNHKRPWTQNGHPKQATAAALTNALFVNPDWNTKPLPEILAEVERQMTPAAARTTPAVLSPTGSAKPPASDKLPSLSAAEKEVAEKMFRNFKGVKSARDAHELYAKEKKVLGKAE